MQRTPMLAGLSRPYVKLGTLKGMKRRKQGLFVGLMGCMVTDATRPALEQRFPHVDVFFNVLETDLLLEKLSRDLWTNDIMQGYTANLKASKDGSLRYNERSGLVDDSVLNRNLKQVYGDLTFEDLEHPLTIIATDLLSGERVSLNQGPIFDAIRASLAIPIIFPP